MIDEAIKMKDEDLKTKLVIAIANQMKKILCELEFRYC